jgi:glutamate-5-semialdehyde dehydrogenase
VQNIADDRHPLSGELTEMAAHRERVQQRLRGVLMHAIAGIDDAGIDPAAVQLVPRAEREAASALVSFPELVPLVILRGSGESTRALARHAAAHDVRTLAHADGGGVLFVEAKADKATVRSLVTQSLDRLGVCNRLNLLLIHADLAERAWPVVSTALQGRSVVASLPPHSHPLGYEWALDSDSEATVTVAHVADLAEAVAIANDQTSGLAAGIATEDADAAEAFLASYAGTGAFWNAPTRLLDGFKLLAVPETGINLDRVAREDPGIAAERLEARSAEQPEIAPALAPLAGFTPPPVGDIAARLPQVIEL